jgi:flagellar motor switch protein FliN/FliY
MGDLMMMGEGNVPYGPEHDDALVELTNQIASSFVLAFNAEAGSAVAVDPAAIGSFSVDNPPEPLTSCDMVLIKLAIQGKPETSVIVLVPEKIGAQLSAKLAAKSSVSAGAVAPQGNSVDSFAPGIGNVVQEHASSPAKLQRSEGVEMLMDVDLDVSIELGRSMLSIKRILELAPGSIVELDRMAGEPVDLLVNNKVVAKGEVVVIDESFGIRILSLVSPEDRIKSLR